MLPIKFIFISFILPICIVAKFQNLTFFSGSLDVMNISGGQNHVTVAALRANGSIRVSYIATPSLTSTVLYNNFNYNFTGIE